MNYLDEEEFYHKRARKSEKKRKTRESTQPHSHHLLKGRVIAVTGEGAVVSLENKKELLCSVKGIIKKEKKEASLITVGDLVSIDEETKKIVHIEERTSFLSRQDLLRSTQQLIAVNIDQVLIVTSFLHPPLKPTLLDRYLIAAEQGNIQPLIIINKIDLLETASSEERQLYDEFLQAYEPLGIPLLSVSAKNNVGLDSLRALMTHKISAFAGQSGVGKSSLLNAAFGLELQTGDLTQKTGKGSHTTTRAHLLPLPEGGFCIDTPGVRSFGIWELQKADLLNHFREFAPFSPSCRYPDCIHLKEPSCAVQAALQEGKISPLRFSSYQKLMEELLEGIEQRQRKRLSHE